MDVNKGNFRASIFQLIIILMNLLLLPTRAANIYLEHIGSFGGQTKILFCNTEHNTKYLQLHWLNRAHVSTILGQMLFKYLGM